MVSTVQIAALNVQGQIAVDIVTLLHELGNRGRPFEQTNNDMCSDWRLSSVSSVIANMSVAWSEVEEMVVRFFISIKN